MLKDGTVDLVEVFLWGGNSVTTALENCIQSLACELLPFTDKTTCRCRPNEEATCI